MKTVTPDLLHNMSAPAKTTISWDAPSGRAFGFGIVFGQRLRSEGMLCSRFAGRASCLWLGRSFELWLAKIESGVNLRGILL
jgi:hypothetical protein